MDMTGLPLAALVVLAAYLVGAVPFGYVVARSRGVDIFQHGSGNIGATNVGRVLGKKFGVLVFLLDFAKGALPTAVAAGLAGRAADFPPDTLPVAAGLAAFLGHLFPIYLRFRGGKGVATGAGVVAVLLPLPTVGAFLAWLAVLCLTRYVSLASVVAAVSLAVVRLAVTPRPFAAAHLTLTAFCVVAAGLVVLRHRSNLARLARGTENHLPESPAMLQFTKVLHVLAVGLWFGSAVFFSFVAALVLFHTFESLGNVPADQRPTWVPVAEPFDKEKGTRLAGAAVGPLFPWYFLIQGVCGLLALATALPWSRAKPSARVHRVRTAVLLLAMLTVVAGWPLVQHVSDLRAARYAADPAVAEAARAAFGRWHAYSLLLNMVTIGLATVAMALTAWLPAAPGAAATPKPREEESAASPAAM
jgi:acyl phosphate:glycerol-3-phosphate acyltransferase